MTITNPLKSILATTFAAASLLGCSAQASTVVEETSKLTIANNAGVTVLSSSDESANVIAGTVHSAELHEGQENDVLVTNIFDQNDYVVVDGSEYDLNYGETVVLSYDAEIPDTLQAEHVISVEKATEEQIEHFEELREEMPTNKLIYNVSLIKDNGATYAINKFNHEVVLYLDQGDVKEGDTVTVEFYNTGTWDEIKNVEVHQNSN